MTRFAFWVALAALAAAGGAQAAPRPTLLLVATQPAIVVRGTHFHASERVHLTLVYDMDMSRKTVRATRGGAFTASFGSLGAFDPCSDSFSVLAVGGTGDRAVVKFIPRECPPSP